MARATRIAIKFDMAGKCGSCIQLDAVWEVIAGARPGTAWRVNCGEHPNVCLVRQANVVPTPESPLAEPSMQVWDGKDFWRYVGPNTAEELMPWLASSLRGQDMASAQYAQLIEPLPLVQDVRNTEHTQIDVIAPKLFHYVRSHGRARSPFHHQEATSPVWYVPGYDAPPPQGDGHHEAIRTAGIGVERHVRTVRLSWSPSIVLLPGFLDHEECDQLIDLAQPLLRESLSAAPDAFVAQTAPLGRGAERTDQSATLHDLMQRVHDLIGVPPDHGEPVQVHRYSGLDGSQNINAAAKNDLPYANIQSYWLTSRSSETDPTSLPPLPEH